MATPRFSAWELESEPRLSPRLVGVLVLGTLGVLYTVALILIARRLTGALTIELPWQQLFTTAVASLAIVTGFRILWRRAYPEPVVADVWIGWGSSLALVLIAVGLGLLAHVRDCAIWLPVLAVDQIVMWRLFGSGPTAAYIEKPQAAAWQKVVRARDASGKEIVTATLRADFVAGQRNATVYVGFCPPLSKVPEISIEPLIGAEAKIMQALPHGARIDVRLGQVAREAMSVSLQLVARE